MTPRPPIKKPLSAREQAEIDRNNRTYAVAMGLIAALKQQGITDYSAVQDAAKMFCFVAGSGLSIDQWQLSGAITNQFEGK